MGHTVQLQVQQGNACSGEGTYTLHYLWISDRLMEHGTVTSLQFYRQTCPAGVRGEVMGVGGLQALLHLLEEIFDLILDLLLKGRADLRRTESTLITSAKAFIINIQYREKSNLGFC